MSKRNSGQERRPRDAYETPAWVTRALVADLEMARILPLNSATGEPLVIWEPAAGNGLMSGALAACGYEVQASDIHAHPDCGACDFLSPAQSWMMLGPRTGAIITNPPYVLAEEFVDRALELMEPVRGLVAMLLSVDWDSAGTRRRLFRDCPAFRRKVVLLDRIVWFEQPDGKEAPSENHAWFVWDFRASTPPAISYAAMPKAERAAMLASRRARRKAWNEQQSQEEQEAA